MLLAMKIKIAITAAALASPVALTVAPVASLGDRSVDAGLTPIAARPFQYRMAGDFCATASLWKRRCAKRGCQAASRS